MYTWAHNCESKQIWHETTSRAALHSNTKYNLVVSLKHSYIIEVKNKISRTKMQNNHERFSVHKLYQRNIERTTDTNRKNSITAITMAATKTPCFSISKRSAGGKRSAATNGNISNIIKHPQSENVSKPYNTAVVQDLRKKTPANAR